MIGDTVDSIKDDGVSSESNHRETIELREKRGERGMMGGRGEREREIWRGRGGGGENTNVKKAVSFAEIVGTFEELPRRKLSTARQTVRWRRHKEQDSFIRVS